MEEKLLQILANDLTTRLKHRGIRAYASGDGGIKFCTGLIDREIGRVYIKQSIKGRILRRESYLPKFQYSNPLVPESYKNLLKNNVVEALASILISQ